MGSLELVNLKTLMERTSGSPHVTFALIDGPVAIQHPELAGERLREISGRRPTACVQASSAACLHGTLASRLALQGVDERDVAASRSRRVS